VSNKTWVKEFHAPAQVPYPQFDRDGQPLPLQGLIIYEGMRLTVYPETGQYDLTFTATVPNMPVTLRMQLEFRNPKRDAKPEEKMFTLTLPLIRLQPPRDARPGDPQPMTFHIAHRGYSSLFLEQPPEYQLLAKAPAIVPCPVLPPITCEWTLTRTGTARFGTPVAIDDPTR
jgi:hypothetical protein